MNITIYTVGKIKEKFYRQAIEEYEKRLRKYVGYEMKVLPDVKNTKHMSETLQKEKEGLLLLEQFLPTDYVILLDERGKQYGSGEFSAFLAQKMLNGIKRLVFVIGGPYGFSEAVYRKADELLSLSKMTFSHQMVRMIFAEQIYRVQTIIAHHPYHRE